MKSAIVSTLAGLVLLLPACRGAAPEDIAPLPEDEIWSFEAERDTLMTQSCPNGAGEGFEMSFLLDTEPVALGTPERVGKALSGVRYAGGWALSASVASFGGLSGLKVLPGGDLLAVSDAGAFVHIPFDQDAVSPTGLARLSFLRDAAGEILTGKMQADAEGLDYRDGLALVSFERQHRILAYGYGLCGSEARGIDVADIGTAPKTFGRSIPGNSGPEALALTGKGLTIGLETVIGGMGPAAVIDADGEAQFAAIPWADGEGIPLVGMDEADGVIYTLHRAWNPLSGNTIQVRRHKDDGRSERLISLARPLSVDNFEGIAAQALPDGRTRLFLIADDNFSDDQQTLLFVFETEA